MLVIQNNSLNHINVKLNDGSNDFKLVNAVSIPPSSKIEILRGKYVLATGYSLKAQSSSSSVLLIL